MSMETLTAAQAKLLLSFPKTLGKHPETGVEITVQDGPTGPYIKAGTESRSLADHAHLARITLEDAVALLAKPREGRGGRSTPQVIADLGPHPDRGDAITLRAGRFGPYVTDGTVNASVPKGKDPASVTIDDAIDLLARREEKLRAEGKDPRAPKRSTRPRRSSTGGARGRRSA
jgi:DNA topoisomerase-1